MENGNGQTKELTQLQERLHDPQVVGVLTRLLDRIDALEQTVNVLATAVSQAPGMISMVTDMADETMRQATAKGIDIDGRLKTALALAEKLTAPDMLARLEQMLALANQMPGMVSMMADMADDAYRQATARGLDIEARLKAGLALAEKLTAPDMTAKVDQLLALSTQLPGLVAMMTDITDESYRQMTATGVDLEERARLSLGLAEKMTRPNTMHSLNHLFDTLLTAESGMLSPEAVQTLGETAQALVASRKRPVRPMGLWATLTALRDPDLQMALGFLTVFGKEFGSRLQK